MSLHTINNLKSAIIETRCLLSIPLSFDIIRVHIISLQMSRPSQRSDTIHTRRLRSACDVCHQAKTRCSGGEPCTACRNSGYDCVYSVSQRLGRPKGTTKHNAHRQRAANTSSAASATGTAATCFTNSALYKTISPFDAEMSIDPSAVINPESLLGPSPKSFWDWMGHDAISNAGLLFNEDQSYLHAPVCSSRICPLVSSRYLQSDSNTSKLIP